MTDLVLNGHTIYINGSTVDVPTGFTATNFQDQINTAVARGTPFLAAKFIWGGAGDLQLRTDLLGIATHFIAPKVC
jgi:hypothetical protein